MVRSTSERRLQAPNPHREGLNHAYSKRSAAAEAARDQVREKIEIIGRAAAFFGGFDGMTKLHNQCEAMTGKTNEIGDVLNRTWDGIGGWWA